MNTDITEATRANTGIDFDNIDWDTVFQEGFESLAEAFGSAFGGELGSALAKALFGGSADADDIFRQEVMTRLDQINQKLDTVLQLLTQLPGVIANIVDAALARRLVTSVLALNTELTANLAVYSGQPALLPQEIDDLKDSADEIFIEGLKALAEGKAYFQAGLVAFAGGVAAYRLIVRQKKEFGKGLAVYARRYAAAVTPWMTPGVPGAVSFPEALTTLQADHARGAAMDPYFNASVESRWLLSYQRTLGHTADFNGVTFATAAGVMGAGAWWQMVDGRFLGDTLGSFVALEVENGVPVPFDPQTDLPKLGFNMSPWWPVREGPATMAEYEAAGAIIAAGLESYRVNPPKIAALTEVIGALQGFLATVNSIGVKNLRPDIALRAA